MTTNIGLLREIRNNEVELMLSWRNAPNVRANMYTHHEISLSEHLTWWERTKKNKHHHYFMYEHHSVPLGIVALTEIDLIAKSSSWAFYAAPGAPTGTGSKMEFLTLDYAFDTLGLQALDCEVLSFNIPVLKLHEKFGFQVVETVKNGHNTGSQYYDIYKLQLTASDWKQFRPLMLKRVEQR